MLEDYMEELVVTLKNIQAALDCIAESLEYGTHSQSSPVEALLLIREAIENK